MVTLKIDNSECSIQGLSPSQLKELRDLLSYELPPQQSFYAGGRARKTSLVNAKGVFPTGLLDYVLEYLYRTSIVFEEKDLRVVPNPRHGLFTMSLGVTPYVEQLDAAEACLSYSRGIVVAPTGVGKSLIVALIINRLQVPTLVVVPTLELKTQLRNSLTEIFGSLRCIDVENIDSLSPTKPTTDYGCVIVDEFHHSGAKSYRKLNKTAWSGIYYKFGMTATPFRSQDHEKLLLESVLSKVIYQVEYQDAVSKGYIVPMEAYYIEVPKTQIKGNERSWPAMYGELVVNNQNRNILLQLLLHNLQGKPTLCLVKEIRHGEALTCDGKFPFMHGEAENNRITLLEFLLQETPVLIGTTGVLGEGVDTKPAEYIIIAGLGKSKNQFMQSVGRGFRRYPGKESCKIIIFLDRSHKFTRNHFKAQVKILEEEYGVIPVRLEV